MSGPARGVPAAPGSAGAPGGAEPPTEALARVELALTGRFPHRMLPDLDRIRDLTELLGQPQRVYPSIHLTGTNGKTSTARMIDALLRQTGLRVGRYTSPHLESVTERISVDGAPLAPERFAAVYDEIIPYVEMVDGRHPEPVTYYELLTALAFSAFADTPVDAAVIEVGMGGRWDATNVIDAPVAVVTPVGLDHQQFLGDTVEQIAAEKAGILRPGAAAILAQQSLPAATVLLAHAAEIGAVVAREGMEFGVLSRQVAVGGQMLTLQGLGGEYPQVYLPLHGAHQAHNAACALAAVEAFLGIGSIGAGTGGQRSARAGGRLDDDLVTAAFAEVTSPGRLERIRTSPPVLLDGAHNVGGAQALVAALSEAFRFDKIVGVVAMLADKDATAVLSVLEPAFDEIVVTTNSSPRALDVDTLAAAAVEVFGPDRVTVSPRLDDAIEDAVRLAEEGLDEGGPLGAGGVVVTGSLVTVGEARTLLRS